MKKHASRCLLAAALVCAPALSFAMSGTSGVPDDETQYYGGIDLIGIFGMGHDVTIKTFNNGVNSNGTTTADDVTMDGAKVSTQSSFGGGVSLVGGVAFSDSLAVEAEVGYSMTRNFDVDSATVVGTELLKDSGFGSYSSFFGFINGIMSFGFNSPVAPFLTAGIGAAYTKLDLTDIEFDATATKGPGLAALVALDSELKEKFSIMFQLGGGGRYDINDKMSLVSAYKFTGSLSDAEFDGSKIGTGIKETLVTAPLYRHNINLGFRYSV